MCLILEISCLSLTLEKVRCDSHSSYINQSSNALWQRSKEFSSSIDATTSRDSSSYFNNDDHPIHSTPKSTNDGDKIRDISFQSCVLPLYESSKSIEEEETNVTAEQPARVKVPPQVKDWVFTCEFDNNDQAKAAIKAEEIWSILRKKDNVEGVKVFYRCNKVKLRGRQCAAEVCLLYKTDSDKVLEFRTNAAHNHDDIIDKPAIEHKQILQLEVESLLNLGVKPINMMHELARKKIFPLPTRAQLTTLIAAIRKRKFGPATISMSALSELLTAHSDVPEEIHKAFVLCHEVNSDAKEPYFRFMITTKHLLSQTKLRCFTHADTTYKCIWQGFPVFMVGTTDWDKAYHPYALCVCTDETTDDFKFVFEGLKNGTVKHLDFVMKQDAIVCDAAFAISNAFLEIFGNNILVIMCWFHVKEAIEWQLRVIVNEKNETTILSDIEYLHLAANVTIFNKAVELFLLKWQTEEPEFCEYFQKIWIDEHPNWFIGAANYIPCHNNALESSNRYLKENHTFRIRHPLAQFINVALETVEKWSNSYTIGLRHFALQPTISLELWTNGYNWARSNIESKIIFNSEDTLVVEIEAQIVRVSKTSKRGVVAPKINSDLKEFFVMEKAEVASAKKPAKRGRRTASKSQKSETVTTNMLQSNQEPTNEEHPPAKKPVKRRPVSKSQKSRNVKRRCIGTSILESNQEPIQPVQTVEAKLLNEVSSPANSGDFETYKNSFRKWTTTVMKGNVLYGSSCNCPAFGNDYICKHIVGVAIRLKLVTPPPEAKTIPIGQKRKRGRPSRNKPALMLQ